MTGTLVLLAFIFALIVTFFGLIGYALRVMWERRGERLKSEWDDVYQAQGYEDEET